jgi:transcriptional regulator with XRE-family HTH domain
VNTNMLAASLTIDPARLLHERASRRLSQSQLAAIAGISHMTVWRIETGRAPVIRAVTVYRLAAALDLETTALAKPLTRGSPDEADH